MTQLASAPLIGAQDIYTSSTTQLHNIGERMETTDGRIFRYARCGTVSAVVTGNLLQSSTIITTHQTLTPSVAALGAASVSVTLGATVLTSNQYAGGYIGVNTTPGNGYGYLVSGHASAAASAAATINLADSIQVATTAASIMDLIANPYAGVIQAPVSTLTGIVVGGGVQPLAVSAFGWVQTHGAIWMLNDTSTDIIGSLKGGVPAVAGAAAVFAGILPPVAYLMKVGVNGKNVPMFLIID